MVGTVTHGLGHWQGVSAVLQQAVNEVLREASLCHLGHSVSSPGCGWRKAVVWEQRQGSREGLEEAGIAYLNHVLFWTAHLDTARCLCLQGDLYFLQNEEVVLS